MLAAVIICLFQNGDTALHISAAMGRLKLTKILLESGCYKDAKNKQGETSMDISRRKNLVDIITILQNPPPLLSQEDRQDQVLSHSIFSPNIVDGTFHLGGCCGSSKRGKEKRKNFNF